MCVICVPAASAAVISRRDCRQECRVWGQPSCTGVPWRRSSLLSAASLYNLQFNLLPITSRRFIKRLFRNVLRNYLVLVWREKNVFSLALRQLRQASGKEKARRRPDGKKGGAIEKPSANMRTAADVSSGPCCGFACHANSNRRPKRFLNC